jgi:hypothetical protein
MCSSPSMPPVPSGGRRRQVERHKRQPGPSAPCPCGAHACTCGYWVAGPPAQMLTTAPRCTRRPATGDWRYTRAVIEGAWTSVPSPAVRSAAIAAVTLLPMTEGTTEYSLAWPSAGARRAALAVRGTGVADETTVVTSRAETSATAARAIPRRTTQLGRRRTVTPFCPK